MEYGKKKVIRSYFFGYGKVIMDDFMFVKDLRSFSGKKNKKIKFFL